ncbi:MAG: holin [Clostridia bacterium]|nr:holin [Clostridia bacterium]
MIDLTKIFEAILALCAALVTTFLIPWIKQRLTAGQQEVLSTLIETAVLAAEQMYGSGMGQEKLKAVLDYLHGKGYDVDVEQIEAVVYALINCDKEPVLEEGPEEE